MVCVVFNVSVEAKTKKTSHRRKAKIEREWKVANEIDEYTQLPKKLLSYHDSSRSDDYFKYYPSAQYSVEDSLLAVATYFKGLPYFDQSWDAIINNGGKFPTKVLEVSIRFIKPDNNYEEFTYIGILTHTSVEIAGQDFMGLLMMLVDPSLMKESNSVSLRWEDELVGESFTYNINLSGFTKVYNKVQ